MIRVEVVRALRDEQILVALELEEGATAQEAVERSRVLERLPAPGGQALVLGIFGRIVPGDTRLNDGDRVEIYRPLEADPSVARRVRAARRRDSGP